MAEQSVAAKKHSVLIDERQKIVVAGVVEVISCDSDLCAAVCADSMLVLHGENLKMSNFDVKQGKLEIEGLLLSLEYARAPSGKKQGRQEGLLKRLLK